MMSEIVTPVPSATVTLVRDTDAGIEVLMMQRRLQSSFVPGMYVFPGGAIDAEDHAQDMQALCPRMSDAEASAALGMASGGLAYWVAVIRESFEEAGLLLAYDAQDKLVTLDAPEPVERFRSHRHELNQGKRGLLEVLRAEQLTLAVDQLVYFAHWITPVGSPRRYDTRFFVGVAPPAQAPLHDNQETISHVWVRPRQALDPQRKDEFKMRFPTKRTLEEFAAYDSVGALMQSMRAKRDIPTILPRIKDGGARVLPGEPGYLTPVEK
jgi:8-oxo-dGTP pyrophosphatase MutT (NUDIX family)